VSLDGFFISIPTGLLLPGTCNAHICKTTNPKEVRNQNYEAKKMNTAGNFKKKKDKNLPWWVELLFVQIGLPDSLLIKILKSKKNSVCGNQLKTNLIC